MTEALILQLGEFAPFHYGKALPARDRNPVGTVPVYGSNGVTGYHDQKLTSGGTIVVGRKGTVGALHFSPGPCWPIDTTFYVTDDDPELLRFKYYALKSLGLATMNSDSAVPGLNRDVAHAQLIRVPPECDQRAIAHILGTLDDKIELNRRINETLEEIARAVFKSWFVDFDPVRAKAEGRDPGLPKYIADLFPDRFESPELGEVPAGWRIAGLDEIANYLNGLALQKYPVDGRDGETLPVIKIAQLRKGDVAGASRCNTDVPADYVVNDGDVLFSWSGSLEVEIWCGGRGALNQHLFKVTSEQMPTWFYYLWTKHHLSDFRHTAAGKATTMGHIQRRHLSAAKVLVPSADLMDAMDVVIAPLVERVVSCARESRALAAARDLLLPKLISGEIRVDVADQQASVAL